MTPRELLIFKVVNDNLDVIGEDFETDGDYIAFLSAIVFYLASCCVHINNGKDSDELVSMFAQQLKENSNLLKRKIYEFKR
jgi:hypothetical protein